MYLDSFNIIYDYLIYIILNYDIIYYILNKIKINNINTKRNKKFKKYCSN